MRLFFLLILSTFLHPTQASSIFDAGFTYYTDLVSVAGPSFHAVRTFRNVLAALGDNTLVVCNYYQGTSTKCSPAGQSMNICEFYSEGEGKPIFLACTRMALTFYIYKIVASPNSISITSYWSYTSPDAFSSIQSLTIDYHHRWLYANAITRILVFDLMPINTGKPVLMNFLMLPTLMYGGHPSGISNAKGQLCVTSNPNNMGFMCMRVKGDTFTESPLVQQTGTHFRSIRVYDDVIIAVHAGVYIFNATTYELMSATTGITPVGGLLDMIRSGSQLLVVEWSYEHEQGNMYLLDLTDLTFPMVLQSWPFTRPVSLFNDVNTLFVVHWMPPASMTFKYLLNSTLSADYAQFYRDSQYFQYGLARNSLQAEDTPTLLLTDTQPWIQLPSTAVRDIHIPSAVTVSFRPLRVPFPLLLETRAATKEGEKESWSPLVPGTLLPTSHFLDQRVRARIPEGSIDTLQWEEYMEWSVDNGRGSTLVWRLSLSFRNETKAKEEEEEAKKKNGGGGDGSDAVVKEGVLAWLQTGMGMGVVVGGIVLLLSGAGYAVLRHRRARQHAWNAVLLEKEKNNSGVTSLSFSSSMTHSSLGDNKKPDVYATASVMTVSSVTAVGATLMGEQGKITSLHFFISSFMNQHLAISVPGFLEVQPAEYHLCKQLAAGGGGTVWLADHLSSRLSERNNGNPWAVVKIAKGKDEYLCVLIQP